MKERFNINEIAEILEVNPYTLRVWDKKGIFPSRRDNLRGHRYYFEDDLENFFSNNYKYFFRFAEKWFFSKKPVYLPDRFYCQDAFIFKARLSKLEKILQEDQLIGPLFSLITSVVGEIGNNSFDHNLGNWPDTPGIFFGYNLKEKKVILADRGLGVLTTLKRIKPELSDDKSALLTAFTEIITGRSPEHRGNGLKYVRKIINDYKMSLWFQSGAGVISLTGEKISVFDSPQSARGTFAVVDYKNLL